MYGVLAMSIISTNTPADGSPGVERNTQAFLDTLAEGGG